MPEATEKMPSDKYSVRDASRVHHSDASRCITFSGDRWGKIPLSVALDERLSHAAVRLYSVISAHKFNGKPLRVGQRLLAEALKWNQSTVSRHIAALVECGHLTLDVAKKGARGRYVLVEKGVARPVSLLACGNCKRACKLLGMGGFCRSCARDIEDERRYREALAVIGRDATPEQVAQHLHLEKITKRWRKIARRVSDSRAACA